MSEIAALKHDLTNMDRRLDKAREQIATLTKELSAARADISSNKERG